jgi:hypothetical protein
MDKALAVCIALLVTSASVFISLSSLPAVARDSSDRTSGIHVIPKRYKSLLLEIIHSTRINIFKVKVTKMRIFSMVLVLVTIASMTLPKNPLTVYNFHASLIGAIEGFMLVNFLRTRLMLKKMGISMKPDISRSMYGYI